MSKSKRQAVIAKIREYFDDLDYYAGSVGVSQEDFFDGDEVEGTANILLAEALDVLVQDEA